MKENSRHPERIATRGIARRILFFLVFISLNSFAEHDKTVFVTIDNEIYYCSKSNETGGCKDMIDTFSQKVNRCLQNYKGPYERSSQCIPSEWNDFKRSADKSCIYKASLVCFDYCVEYYNGPYERTGVCKEQCKTE